MALPSRYSCHKAKDYQKKVKNARHVAGFACHVPKEKGDLSFVGRLYWVLERIILIRETQVGIKLSPEKGADMKVMIKKNDSGHKTITSANGWVVAITHSEKHSFTKPPPET